eukprot:CAMPEP_0197467662 /NCGR_PEP_ID=MMETSP1175-20131217/65682_1 /TAXON_ID=1003142 /ORGANISM="Triceratium dubium, Strain CCMP147" /LENGTH=250 /DNA_ID=CAMNT_0043003741 /DNA_START=802 /DNA_END=1552 /DNA_ORIENTATION=+
MSFLCSAATPYAARATGRPMFTHSYSSQQRRKLWVVVDRRWHVAAEPTQDTSNLDNLYMPLHDPAQSNTEICNNTFSASRIGGARVQDEGVTVHVRHTPPNAVARVIEGKLSVEQRPGLPEGILRSGLDSSINANVVDGRVGPEVRILGMRRGSPPRASAPPSPEPQQDVLLLFGGIAIVGLPPHGAPAPRRDHSVEAARPQPASVVPRQVGPIHEGQQPFGPGGSISLTGRRPETQEGVDEVGAPLERP